MPKLEVSPEFGKRPLVICRPFRPDERSRDARLCFHFVDPDRLDFESTRVVAATFPRAYLERSLAAAFERAGEALPPNTERIDDFVRPSGHEGAPRVALMASNDTHAFFLLKVAEHFSEKLFIIPKLSDKDEGALRSFNDHGVEPIQIGFNDTTLPALEAFKPDLILVGADWTDEFHALHRIALGLGVPCVSLQEGPQFWHMTRSNRYANKYRNADILLAQGRVTLREIHPHAFAITGNPKVDRIDPEPLPERPRVFINCNFTYGQWEDCRQQWMEDCLSVCKELGLDYIISKHPRDTSQWDDPNLVKSHTFVVRDQLRACSIVVSRLSSLTYEALGAGRESVYYNPHGEPIPTFNADETPGILKAFDREQLRAILARHQNAPRFDREAAEASMREHCGPPDGGALDRVIRMMRAIAHGRAEASPLIDSHRFVLESFQAEPARVSVVYCFRDRDPKNVARSVASLRAASKIAFRPVVVDYGSAPNYRVELQNLCKQENITFIRADTMGWPWSRGHALNIGARQAQTEYLMFTDIDMVFEGDILEEALRVCEDETVVHCRPMWLPETGNRDEARQGNYDQKGGFMLLRREIFDRIGGFDERFRYWGLEDLDVNNRLTRAGIRSVWLDDFRLMFHVWHPLSYGFLSEDPKVAWYDSVRRSVANLFEPERNPDWGRNITLDDRPVIKRMNSSKPDYHRVAFNRLHLDFHKLMDEKLGNAAEGDFYLIALGSRFTDAAQNFLDRHQRLVRWLEQKLAVRGFVLERFQNRNIDYLYLSLDYLRTQGLKDYFIKPDLSMVYLLF